MRMVISTLLCFWCSTFFGQISVGTQSLESQFARADVICVCLLAKSMSPRPSELPRQSYVYKVTVVQAYKGETSGGLVEIKSESGLLPLPYDTRYLLMLINGSAKNETHIVNALLVPQDFPLYGKQSATPSLEGDIDAYLTVQPNKGGPLIDLIEQLDALSPATESILSNLGASSSNKGIALTSMMILLRKNVNAGQIFPLLLAKLMSTPPEQYPSFDEISFIFLQNAKPSEINAFETLAGSSNVALQHAALRALRKLAEPNTTGFLIKELDASDSNSQYLALITLAEIHHKTGVFGPALGEFEEDKNKYIRAWKDWYSTQK